MHLFGQVTIRAAAIIETNTLSTYIRVGIFDVQKLLAQSRRQDWLLCYTELKHKLRKVSVELLFLQRE